VAALAVSSVNPRSCVVSFKVQQSGRIQGGTGRFTAATGTFTGTVTGRGLAPRNPDGSCNLDQTALFAVDAITASGSRKRANHVAC
jgi:hypothetical protein